MIRAHRATAIVTRVGFTTPSMSNRWSSVTMNSRSGTAGLDELDELDERTTARYNGKIALPMILRDQYDAIIFVDEVTPRVMLY
jgi:hypothetical protein